MPPRLIEITCLARDREIDRFSDCYLRKSNNAFDGADRHMSGEWCSARHFSFLAADDDAPCSGTVSWIPGVVQRISRVVTSFDKIVPLDAPMEIKLRVRSHTGVWLGHDCTLSSGCSTIARRKIPRL